MKAEEIREWNSGIKKALTLENERETMAAIESFGVMAQIEIAAQLAELNATLTSALDGIGNSLNFIANK